MISEITFEVAKKLGITDGTYPLAIPTREQVVVITLRAIKRAGK